MTRIMVDLDEALLHGAARALGTDGVDATIVAALAAAVRSASLPECDVRAFDINDADVTAARAVDQSDQRRR